MSEKRRGNYWDWLPVGYRRVVRKRSAKDWKAHLISTRQVRRATTIVNRAPSLIHNGKAYRR